MHSSALPCVSTAADQHFVVQALQFQSWLLDRLMAYTAKRNFLADLAGCQAPHTVHTHIMRANTLGSGTVDACLMEQLLSAASRYQTGTATGHLCLAEAVQDCTC